MLKELVKACKPLPPKSKLLILGGGFSGQHIAALARGLGTEVLCSRRKADASGADIVFDSGLNLLPANEEINDVTHLLSCIPPEKNGKDPVLELLLDQIKNMPLKWVGYLSTTGVYGDFKGGWVTESNTPKPQQPRSQRRLACEKAWEASGLPLQILRLPGIYGPGRSALESLKAGKVRMIEKPNQVFSRVHIDDIAGAAIHLINLAEKGEKPSIINISDDLPIENTEVLRYAGKLLDIKLPPNESFDLISNQLSPMALSFWQESRRVSNDLLCKQLGYKLIQPNYKLGLNDCLIQYQLRMNC